MNNVVIGKRITVGAAINSVAAIFANIYPEHASTIVSITVPLTFVVQVIIVNKFGITQ